MSLEKKIKANRDFFYLLGCEIQDGLAECGEIDPQEFTDTLFGGTAMDMLAFLLSVAHADIEETLEDIADTSDPMLPEPKFTLIDEEPEELNLLDGVEDGDLYDAGSGDPTPGPRPSGALVRPSLG